MFDKRRHKSGRGFLVGLGVAAAGIGVLRSALASKYDLNGKVVFITGGSRGLGLELAREYGKRGAKLAICARDKSELARAGAELRESGYVIETFPCDITDKEQVETTISSVQERMGPIDVLVNNAGIISVGPLDSMTLEDFQESLATHFWAPLYTMMSVLPDMRRRGEGRIVNISSIGGLVSVPHLVAYSAGKFALAGLSEGVRAEALSNGVRVTTVYPGLMRTGSPRNAYFKGKHRAEYAWFSVSAGLPGFSMSAKRAARAIVNACVQGRARLVLSLPAKAAAVGYRIIPGAPTLLSLAAKMLPGIGGIGIQKAAGRDSESVVSPSWLTALNERAALRNNEVA